MRLIANPRTLPEGSHSPIFEGKKRAEKQTLPNAHSTISIWVQKAGVLDPGMYYRIAQAGLFAGETFDEFP